MNTPNARPASSPRITSEEWDELRETFKHSLLADTSIAALADNIDGCQWPKKGPEETPAAYIGLAHEAALARLASLRLSAAHLDKLADILRGTLAFDQSFGEMAEVAGRAEAENDPLTRNLARLGIPQDFPVALCNFTPEIHHYCHEKDLVVLADFFAFSRDVARSAIVAGEFRELLNACVHIDERVVARYLPYRLKTSGLHLVEGLAHLVRSLDPETRALLRRNPVSALSPDARAQAESLIAYFQAEYSDLLAAYETGTPAERFAAALGDSETEADVAAVLGLYLSGAPAPAHSTEDSEPAHAHPDHAETPDLIDASAGAEEEPAKKSGFFRRLFGRG